MKNIPSNRDKKQGRLQRPCNVELPLNKQALITTQIVQMYEILSITLKG